MNFSEKDLAGNYFTLPSHIPFQDFFDPAEPVWQWVDAIHLALQSFDFLPQEASHHARPGLLIDKNVFIHPSVELPAYGVIHGPTWIGAETILRPGVFIRGNVIVGQGCVLGHACEYKNALLMDGVETAHFNYIGDSILGSRSHLGAGAIIANVRLDRENVFAYSPTGKHDTGRRKFGAIIGEGVEIGCNAVVQPGTIIAKNALVLPCKPIGKFVPGRED